MRGGPDRRSCETGADMLSRVWKGKVFPQQPIQNVFGNRLVEAYVDGKKH
jgi:hypothetical protein